MKNIDEFELIDLPKLGEPLEYDVYNSNGSLLLAKGKTIHTEEQLERLLNTGTSDGIVLRKAIYSVKEKQIAKEKSADIAFRMLRAKLFTPTTIEKSYRHLKTLMGTGDKDKFLSGIKVIATNIKILCEVDADSVMGYITFDNKTVNKALHAYKHCVQVALMTEIIARDLGWDWQERESIISAALTMNISAMSLHGELSGQMAGLSKEQREAIDDHPRRSVVILSQAYGVTDNNWLNAVYQHHERFDGTGYPNQMIGDKIYRGARLLQLIDFYCAKNNGRTYRKSLPPIHALREILNKDDVLGMQVIKSITVYPPGTIVELVNGEIGVVIKRDIDGRLSPDVKVMVSSTGFLLTNHIVKTTGDGRNAIKSVVPLHKFKARVDNVLLWFPQRKQSMNH